MPHFLTRLLIDIKGLKTRKSTVFPFTLSYDRKKLYADSIVSRIHKFAKFLFQNRSLLISDRLFAVK